VNLSSPDTILVISQLPPPTHGSTVITKVFLDVLEQAGFRTRLVDRRFSRGIGDVGGFTLRKVLAAPGLALRLLGAARQTKSRECVFFCTNRPFSFLVDVVLSEILRARKIRTINYLHTRGYGKLAARGRVWSFLVKRLLKNAELTVCLSDDLRRDVLPMVGSRPVLVIPNTPWVADDDGIVPERVENRVLFLSNLLTEKGADIFVDAAVSVCGAHPTATFAIAGPTADASFTRQLKERVAASGHADRIDFIGEVQGPTKWRCFRTADVLVFPSRYRYEAQPLTIIEAFREGTPVIASRVGAIHELVRQGQNGVLLEENDPTHATDAILAVLGSPTLRESLGAGARATYDESYSREAFTSAWVDAIEVFRSGQA
jgi:glycosyltransferase involved in cell wall biosynthesis